MASGAGAGAMSGSTVDTLLQRKLDTLGFLQQDNMDLLQEDNIDDHDSVSIKEEDDDDDDSESDDDNDDESDSDDDDEEGESEDDLSQSDNDESELVSLNTPSSSIEANSVDAPELGLNDDIQVNMDAEATPQETTVESMDGVTTRADGLDTVTQVVNAVSNGIYTESTPVSAVTVDPNKKPARKRKRTTAPKTGRKKDSSKKQRKKRDKKRKMNERANIRKIKGADDLEDETRAAQEEEQERRKRLMGLKQHKPAFPPFVVPAMRNLNTAQAMSAEEKASHLKSLLEAAEEEAEIMANKEKKIIDLAKEDEKKPAEKKPAVDDADVITLSSDEEEDNDDVMVADKFDSDEDTEEIEDTNDSGYHVNDEDNMLDEEGRVLVNVEHPPEDPDIFLAPQIARAIKPHQIGGVRFLYDNMVESVGRFRASHGFGCILAHSMGLGKTIQVIAFLDILLRHTNTKTVMCIVPINTLQNWMAEFNRWLPKAEPDKEKPSRTASSTGTAAGSSSAAGSSAAGSAAASSLAVAASSPITSSLASSVAEASTSSVNIRGFPSSLFTNSSSPMSSLFPAPVVPQLSSVSSSIINRDVPLPQTSTASDMLMAQTSNRFDMPSLPTANALSMPTLPTSSLLDMPSFQTSNSMDMPSSFPTSFGMPPPQRSTALDLSLLVSNELSLGQTSTTASTTSALPGLQTTTTSGMPMVQPSVTTLNTPPLLTSLSSSLLSADFSSSATIKSEPLPESMTDELTSSLLSTDEPDSLSASIDAVMAKVLSECASSSWPSSPSAATLSTNASLLSDLGATSQSSSCASFAGQAGETSAAAASNEEVVDEGPILTRSCTVFLLNDSYKTMAARAALISQWYQQGGILLLGYEMYRLLASKNMALNVKPKGRRGGKVQPGKPDFIDLDEEDRKAELIEDMQGALMRPGPDIVVCDEGHRIKNSQAGISQALKNIRTRRRVVLTGYPLQNNLLEYWCMVDFVRPNYLGTRTEFSNMFERPIINGQCADSTAQDMRVMRFRAHVLHSLLEGFVQRRGHTVLQNTLPPKSEYVFFVNMSPVQRNLYRRFMTQLRNDMDDWTVPTNPLRAFAVCCKIWNHPDVMYKVIQRHGLATDDADLDIDGEIKDGTDKKHGARRKAHKRRQNPESLITYDWAEPLFQNYTPGLLENSSKMVILLDLVQHSIEAGDKILIFSQSLSTLDLIEYFLSKHKVPYTETDEHWAANKNYFRLDGSTPGLDRERMINRFNKPDYKFWIFLLSTRAGSLGINLIGANRVIVVDASWNPCHDCQAVCRVYRYGQVKPCYVYRLVTNNSIEKKIYDRQISKQGMSDRVVDELNPQSVFCRNDSNLLKYEDKEETSFDLSQCKQEFDDDVMLCMLEKHGHRLAKEPFTHESLLIDKKELRLTRREKRIAKQSYAMEKRMSLSYTRPAYGNAVAGSRYYPRPPGVVNPMINRRPFPFNNSWGSYNRPVASVKPMLSTPVPLQPRRPVALADHNPVPHLTRPGVTIHKVTTTTDIMLPGAASPDSRCTFKRIPAGQQVLVIKTPVGVYIRTDEGKIFAVRTKSQNQDQSAPRSSSDTESLLSQLASTGKTVTVASTGASMAASRIRPTIVQSPMSGAGMSNLPKGNQMKSLLASTISSMRTAVTTVTTTTATTSTASVKSLTVSSALPMHDLSSLVDEAMSIENSASTDLHGALNEEDDDEEEAARSSTPPQSSSQPLLDLSERSMSNPEWGSSQGDGSELGSQSKRNDERETRRDISSEPNQLDKPSTSIAASSSDDVIRDALENQRPSSIEDLLNADSSDFFESLGLVTDQSVSPFSASSSVPVTTSVVETIGQVAVPQADSLTSENQITASVPSTHSSTSSASSSRGTNSTNPSVDPLSLPPHSYPYHLPPHPFSHHPHLPTSPYSLASLGYPPYPLPNYAAYGFPQPMYPTPGSVLGTPMPLPMYSPYADRRLLDSGFLSMGPYSGMGYPNLTSPSSVPLNTNVSSPISPSVSNTSTENSDTMTLNASIESQSSIPLNSNIAAGQNNGQFRGQISPQSLPVPNNFHMHPSISGQNNTLFSGAHMPSINNDQYNAGVGSPTGSQVNLGMSSQVSALWNPAMDSSLTNKVTSENSVNVTEPLIQPQPTVPTSMSHTPPMQQP